ncbi:fluoride efflux transporter CrcB [Castellaniella caeni]|uniref:fluoride efflux transporter CrcB n=1 Tax=Castellaniella caeni TaxID=266123 RepID=UPI0008358345|nr:fluoride efflux transporter CrcB [Castellaniella caeni]
MMPAVIGIGAGAALGALLRWVLGMSLNGLWPTIPLGTLAANLLGGLLIGAASEFLGSHGSWSPVWRLFIITGFLGGLTTFSTFSLEVTTLLQQRELGFAALQIALHMAGSIILVLAGVALVQLFARG